MITEKNSIKCEAIFNEDRTHRYLWRRVWDKEKPIVSVIMLNPCQADNIITDTTTYLVVNNVAKLEEFGGVDILNLYSKLATKLKFREESDDELNDPENDAFIVKSVMESSKTILAWGKAVDNNARIEERAIDVINLLEKHHDKLYVISDGERTGLHPLTPCIRNKWILEKFNVELSGFLKSLMLSSETKSTHMAFVWVLIYRIAGTSLCSYSLCFGLEKVVYSSVEKCVKSKNLSLINL